MSAAVTSTKRTPARAAAVAVVAQPEPTAFGYGNGRHLVQDHQNYAWPDTNAGDILDIDFDCREYRGEGRYLVQYNDDDTLLSKNGFSGRWVGVRRFTNHVGSARGLHIFENTIEGRAWQPLPPERQARIMFLGKVHAIYRRTERGTQPGVDFCGRLSALGEEPDGKAFLEFQPGGGRTLRLSGLTGDDARRLAPLMMDAMKLEVTS